MKFHFWKTLLWVIKLTYHNIRYKLFIDSWVTITIASLITVFMFIPNGYEIFYFQPQKILEQHQYWRIITAPLVHSSWDHFTWNMIVMLASSLVSEKLNRRLYLTYLFAVVISTSLFKLLTQDIDQISSGFSNIASGSFVLLLMLIAFEGLKDKDFWLALVPAILLVMFVSHELNFLWGETTAWQAMSGRNLGGAPTKQLKIGHIVGIITGALVASSYFFTTLIKQQR